MRGRGRAACVDVAGIPHRRWQDQMRDKSIQGWCKKPRVWTRWLRVWTWPYSFSLKEDIKCKEISSIDAVHNRTMTLAC